MKIGINWTGEYNLASYEVAWLRCPCFEYRPLLNSRQEESLSDELEIEYSMDSRPQEAPRFDFPLNALSPTEKQAIASAKMGADLNWSYERRMQRAP